MWDCSFDDPENFKTSKMVETNKLSFLPFLFFYQTLFFHSPSLHVLTIYLHQIHTFYAKPSAPAASYQSVFSLCLPCDNLVAVNMWNLADMCFYSPPSSRFLLTSQTFLLRAKEQKCPPFFRHLRDSYEMCWTNGRPRLERCGKFNSTPQVFSSNKPGFSFDVCRPPHEGATWGSLSRDDFFANVFIVRTDPPLSSLIPLSPALNITLTSSPCQREVNLSKVGKKKNQVGK